ncbi:hypothetical protein CDL12_23568 [Handroanthus impetiginosus]|uniref:HTH OST-type domain-containing protein n=1 Tax=Handroanthus impetiginosus TaxID=429701 RepID=A0A2G9GF37_9LAMI|nr:hypothetical protein CDL12_23568 [Handroanthus impetiginosus]
MALRVHPVIDGAVTMFSAYGDFNSFSRRLREGCQRTGVKLVDVPNGRKDAADKAILVDMFLFALDHPPPSSIMLISGDVDFAPALHILGQRGYTVILVIPSGGGVSSALSNAGRFVWDWPSVARGDGFVPPARALIPPSAASAEKAGFFMGCQTNDNPEVQNEEETIVYRGLSKISCNTRELSMESHSEYSNNSRITLQNPSTSRSCSLPPGLNEASNNQNNVAWVQPGDLNGLKGQLIKLLETSGSLPLARLTSEYQKVYGRTLHVSEYGASKLVNLLKKMADSISVDGQGQKKTVCICNSKSGSEPPRVILSRREKKEKGAREDYINIKDNIVTIISSDEDERMANRESTDRRKGESSQIIDRNLKKFKYELQEILVSYSCQFSLGSFETIYHQRYKKQLDYVSFGVNHLEELLEKVRDVVVLQEEPVSKRKFVVAVGGR